MFVVTENQALACGVAEVLFDPAEFIAPGGGVFPWGGGKDVGVEQGRKLAERFKGASHWLHQAENAGGFVITALIAFTVIAFEGVNAGTEIDEGVVHVEIEGLLHMLCV